MSANANVVKNETDVKVIMKRMTVGEPTSETGLCPSKHEAIKEIKDPVQTGNGNRMVELENSIGDKLKTILKRMLANGTYINQKALIDDFIQKIESKAVIQDEQIDELANLFEKTSTLTDEFLDFKDICIRLHSIYVELDWSFYKNSKHEEAQRTYDAYERASEDDNLKTIDRLKAIHKLGSFYHLWDKPAAAFRYYKRAAGEGFLPSIKALTYCYENQYGVVTDPKVAFEHYQFAADLGDLRALYLLGTCYENGIGVEKDPKKAFTSYCAAADKDKGCVTAHYALTHCYQNGIGTLRDSTNAKKHRELAVKKMLGDEDITLRSATEKFGINILSHFNHDINKLKDGVSKGSPDAQFHYAVYLLIATEEFRSNDILNELVDLDFVKYLYLAAKQKHCDAMILLSIVDGSLSKIICHKMRLEMLKTAVGLGSSTAKLIFEERYPEYKAECLVVKVNEPALSSQFQVTPKALIMGNNITGTTTKAVVAASDAISKDVKTNGDSTNSHLVEHMGGRTGGEEFTAEEPGVRKIANEMIAELLQYIEVQKKIQEDANNSKLTSSMQTFSSIANYFLPSYLSTPLMQVSGSNKPQKIKDAEGIGEELKKSPITCQTFKEILDEYKKLNAKVGAGGNIGRMIEEYMSRLIKITENAAKPKPITNG